MNRPEVVRRLEADLQARFDQAGGFFGRAREESRDRQQQAVKRLEAIKAEVKARPLVSRCDDCGTVIHLSGAGMVIVLNEPMYCACGDRLCRTCIEAKPHRDCPEVYAYEREDY